MSANLQWFRLYHRIIDDEKIRLLAFEDRWHFIAICCLKADGLLDEPEGDLKQRKIAVKLGVQLRELDEIKRRLCEVGLVTETFHPVSWNDLQYQSDSSTERVRRFREKQKKSEKANKNNGETQRNVSVTVQDTETETDTDKDRGREDAPPADFAFVGKTIKLKVKDFDRWQKAYSAVPDFIAELTKADDYYTENPPDDGKWFFPVSRWLEKAHREASKPVHDPDEEIYRNVL